MKIVEERKQLMGKKEEKITKFSLKPGNSQKNLPWWLSN